MDSILGLVRHGGNEGLFKAIEMSVLATAAGHPLHLHAEGLRGTGKTTIMRAVRRVLPKIRRIKGCLYNCDPAYPHCPQHRLLSPEEIAALGDELVSMPFLEISHSAKIGTVVGSIDLARLVSPTHPEAALLPGTIPQAHRGIIFVDEVNRLAETSPELADILLDVMGTKPGRIQIEETGLPPVELPVRVTVWAASNPDEDPGPLEEIRRQLSDRFDLAVYTDRPGESAVVEQILASTAPCLLGSGRPRPIGSAEEVRAEGYRTRVAGRLALFRTVDVPSALRQQIADLYSRFNVESLRAVQALYVSMRLAACLGGRSEATLEDLARMAPLVLRHRVDPETLKRVTAHLAGLNPRAEGEASTGSVSRHRLASLGFGGVAAAPVGGAAPAAPPRAEQPELDRPAPEAASGGQWDWPAAPTRPAEAKAGWLSRTMNRLRRNLGLARTERLARPEPSPQGGAPKGAPVGLPGGSLGGTSPPGGGWPGPGSAGGSRPGLGSADGAPVGSLRGRPQSPGTGSAADLAADAGGRNGGPESRERPVKAANPLEHPPEAPPHPARPLAHLQPHEYIRTEEELGAK